MFRAWNFSSDFDEYRINGLFAQTSSTPKTANLSNIL